jgi:hypothetical protein
MIAKQEHVRLLFLFIALLPTLSLTMAGCGEKPQPTFSLEVSPGTEVQVGKDVAIVAQVDPLEELDLKWSVSGTAEGKLNTDTGEQVVYTAGEEGTDIVVAEGTTASGMPVKQTVTLLVAEVPPTSPPQPPTNTPSLILTEAPTPPPQPPSSPSPTGCDNFTSIKVIRSPLPPASSGTIGGFSAPQHCETGLPAGKALSVGGTATNVPEGHFLWLLVYAPDTYHYPQCDNALRGQCGANLSGGIWAVKTFIGREGCKEHFHLVLVTMNQSDNDQLTQEMIQRAKAEDFAFERDELPASVEEIASIEVETAGSICD